MEYFALPVVDLIVFGVLLLSHISRWKLREIVKNLEQV